MRSNEFQLVVNFGDTDRAGIVFYPNYFKWFDIASHQFFRSIGRPMSVMEAEENIIIPLLDVRCTFEKPLYYDDVITIKTTVAEISNKSFTLNHEIYRGDTRTGYGYEVHGWVKREGERIAAVPIPDEIRQLLLDVEPGVNNQINPWLSA